MARYDGMEDLLRRVSERLAVSGPSSAPVAEPEPEYAELLEQMLLLVRDVTELTDSLPSYAGKLSAEQQADLAALLRRARHGLDRLEPYLTE